MDSAIDDLFFNEYDLNGQFPSEEREKAELNEKESASFLMEIIKDNEKAVNAFKMYQLAKRHITYTELSYYYKRGFRQGFQIAIDGMREE
ncbi:MAG: hypothetical protein HDP28_01610 [Clostridia bacterium]|nr:hypothetical protein [Clostridia bacterium]